MRNIDDNAVKAKEDKSYTDSFIKEQEHFILQATHKATGRYVTKSDDRWSISLSAFHEAIKSYSYEKGSFLSFAQMVIRRRLSDEYKKQSKHLCEVPINPFSFDSDADEEDEDISLKREVIASVVSKHDDGAKYEIEAITSVLQGYGVSFMDLVSASPKSKKTKILCAKAIACICKNKAYLEEMRRTKALPLKSIEKNPNLPRKSLERHRKYIIAGVEILSGEYPILSEYLTLVREELSK